MGIYRGQVKSPTRLGMNPSLENQPGIYTHWEKAKAKGQKLPAAVILGCPPCVAFTSAQKLPEDVDELYVAGGLAGSAINVVKCKTVDLLVPAEAEIVIEGYIITEWLEPEAPFGESHGHVNLQEYNAYMEVTAITRRKKAILTSIISQVTPSESSLIKQYIALMTALGITVALFLLFSTLCGMAWSLESMIAFRAAQGFTGGVLIPTAIVIVRTHACRLSQPQDAFVGAHSSGDGRR